MHSVVVRKWSALADADAAAVANVSAVVEPEVEVPVLDGWVEPKRDAVTEATAAPPGVTVCRSPEEVLTA